MGRMPASRTFVAAAAVCHGLIHKDHDWLIAETPIALMDSQNASIFSVCMRCISTRSCVRRLRIAMTCGAMSDSSTARANERLLLRRRGMLPGTQ